MPEMRNNIFAQFATALLSFVVLLLNSELVLSVCAVCCAVTVADFLFSRFIFRNNGIMQNTITVLCYSSLAGCILFC